jgi:hypothetical protein
MPLPSGLAISVTTPTPPTLARSPSFKYPGAHFHRSNSDPTHPSPLYASRRASTPTRPISNGHPSQGSMQYQDPGQGSGAGKASSNSAGSGNASGSKPPPRPLRAPAPGPLNLNYQPNPHSQQQQMPNQYHYQNQYDPNVPPGYMAQGQGYGMPRPSSSGGQQFDVSPFQTTNNSLPSGSASSSPVNQFRINQQPYMNLESTDPHHMSMAPLAPSEPRMGHYSNYQSYHPYDQQWQQAQQPLPQINEPGPSSRRSTISNSDQERPSRPSTSDNKSKAKDFVKIEPVPQEDDEDDPEEKLDHRKRKRNRTIRSCVPCHNHKRKVSTTHVQMSSG